MCERWEYEEQHATIYTFVWSDFYPVRFCILLSWPAFRSWKSATRRGRTWEACAASRRRHLSSGQRPLALLEVRVPIDRRFGRLSLEQQSDRAALDGTTTLGIAASER